jgi:hypothetical protein
MKYRSLDLPLLPLAVSRWFRRERVIKMTLMSHFCGILVMRLSHADIKLFR